MSIFQSIACFIGLEVGVFIPHDTKDRNLKGEPVL